MLFDQESIKVGDHLFLEAGKGDISTRQVSKIVTADDTDKIIDFFTGLDDSLVNTIARTEQREAYLHAIKNEFGAHDTIALNFFEEHSVRWTNEQLVANANIYLKEKPSLLAELSKKYSSLVKPREVESNIIDQLAEKKLMDLQEVSNLPKEEWEEGLEGILGKIADREIERYRLEGMEFTDEAFSSTKRDAYLTALENKYANDPALSKIIREESRNWNTAEVVERAISAFKDDPKVVMGLENIYAPAQKLKPNVARDVYTSMEKRLKTSTELKVGEGVESKVIRVPEDVKKRYGQIADKEVLIKISKKRPSKEISDKLKQQEEIIDILVDRGVAPRLLGSGDNFQLVEEVHGVILGTLPRKQARAFRGKFQELTDILVEEGLRFKDLHVQNIMVTRDGKLKIIDFGFVDKTMNREKLRDYYKIQLNTYDEYMFN